MLLTVHVAAGGLALVLGAVALLGKKGGTIHRRSALLFVYAMLVAKALSESFTTGPMRALPIVLLFGTMFYWLWRVRARRSLPVVVRYDSI